MNHWTLKTLKAVAVMILCIQCFKLDAQDIHFSQFNYSNSYLNPALVATGDADARITAIMRSQWKFANSHYQTYYLEGDHKLNPCFNTSKHKFGLGGSFFYDSAGDLRETQISLSASGSYTYQIDTENAISFGLQTAVSNLKINGFENATTGNQVGSNGIPDFNNPTGEDFDNLSYFYGDVGLGFNYSGRKSIRRDADGNITKFGRGSLDFGIGIFHLNRPKNQYQEGNDTRLDIRYSIYMLPVVEISRSFDVRGKMSVQLQGDYFESVLGAQGIFHFLSAKRSNVYLGLGASVRAKDLTKNNLLDAIIPEMSFGYNDWELGFIYDVNVSSYENASNGRGGPEIFLRKNFNFCDFIPPFRPICKMN